ncbi:MAG: DUF5916 domain-containing protein [Catalinimonas sp.]
MQRTLSPHFLGSLLLVGLFTLRTAAQPTTTAPTPVYITQRIAGAAPKVDGRLTDAAWEQVAWSGNFYQYEPSDEEPASQRTRFKILYDERYLYVAWRCFDTEPERVEARLGRRDEFPGDWVEINFDSFNDKRTGFSFNTSASGVKSDEFISKDGEVWDDSWNPTWFTKARVDSLGWTAECRIPFSQLRFGRADEQVWGLQSNRRLFRYDELDIWAPVKQAQQGFVSRFGTLRGITGVRPRKPLEFQPYVLGQVARAGDFNPDDPFARRTTPRATVGLDGRIGVTNDLAVDFTINPDFGQVEADPGAINLDGFQIFFREQRPFFVENRNIFDYQLTEAEAGGSYTSDLLFYSRRIGGAPSRRVAGGAGLYVDQPENTTILGAVKLSGKTQAGLSVGALNAVTNREWARLDRAGERTRTEVEPLTSYSVSRVQQDLNERNTTVGGMFTAVNRDLRTDELDFLHRAAYAGGLDLLHRWDNRAWYVGANVVASQVRGSEEALLRTQTAFERLFQRPDADHLAVDSTRTQLSGTGGTVRVGEQEGKWVFETGATWRSPGLELNDVGFLLNSEEINYFGWAARRWQQPFGIFRRMRWSHSLFARWDWAGTALSRRYNTNFFAQFKNFWAVNGSAGAEQLDLTKNILRGGPLLRRPPGGGGTLRVNTDIRRKLVLEGYVGGGSSYDGTARSFGTGLEFFYQPVDALSFSVEPELDLSRRDEQYFDQVVREGETVYLSGRIARRTLTVTMRATYNLTPNFTVQYYGQPFIAKGVYDRFNQIGDDPLARRFADRYEVFAPERAVFNADTRRYDLDAEGDGVFDLAFDDPDFSLMQFRSNLVLRWEYRPNSEIFLVWTQGVTTEGDPAKDLYGSLTDDLFGGALRNTFLVKATYRWVR